MVQSTLRTALTKITFKDNKGSNVDEKTDDFRYQHKPVPRMNSESYHNQFSENQRSERYGYHVNEVLIEKEKATEHYDTT